MVTGIQTRRCKKKINKTAYRKNREGQIVLNREERNIISMGLNSIVKQYGGESSVNDLKSCIRKMEGFLNNKGVFLKNSEGFWISISNKLPSDPMPIFEENKPYNASYKNRIPMAAKFVEELIDMDRNDYANTWTISIYEQTATDTWEIVVYVS